jgi:hypothetical protein
VFVGYPYSIPSDDYRGVFADIGKEYGVNFMFADERLTNTHILVKIEAMMEEAAFCLFDITEWNPNVALELRISDWVPQHGRCRRGCGGARCEARVAGKEARWSAVRAETPVCGP